MVHSTSNIGQFTHMALIHILLNLIFRYFCISTLKDIYKLYEIYIIYLSSRFTRYIHILLLPRKSILLAHIILSVLAPSIPLRTTNFVNPLAGQASQKFPLGGILEGENGVVRAASVVELKRRWKIRRTDIHWKISISRLSRQND